MLIASVNAATRLFLARMAKLADAADLKSSRSHFIFHINH
jgi:hypothetical protein